MTMKNKIGIMAIITIVFAATDVSAAPVAPAIVSGTGNVTVDANGAYVVDCPTGCDIDIGIANTATIIISTGSIINNYTGSAAGGGGITILNSGSSIYSTSTNSGMLTGSISGDSLSLPGGNTIGGLIGTTGGTITNTGTIATGGTLTIGLTAITVTGEMLTSWNGATLVNTGTLILIGSTTAGGLTGSYTNGTITLADVTSAGGNIAIGNGVFLSSTASNTIEATLGLGGPRLPAASTTSDPVAFSTWLNDNALVTRTQIDSIGTLVRSGLNSVLFGSHHRILRDNGMTNTGSGFWATGDFARHDPNDTDASIGEFGVYKDITPAWRLGAGAGINQARQGLPLSGSGKLDSSYLVLEGDYQSLATGWTGSATVYLGYNRATISRSYMVGVTPDLSNGDASGSSWALRLRSDWSRITSLSGLEVSPYLAYTRAESRLDGYTETGGALPITFAAQKQTSDELRAGVTLLSRLSEQTDLRFPLELAHRSNDSTVITGVIAATPFSFSNAGSKQNWGRAGIELDHRLNRQTVLNGAVLFASRGGDSSWLGTVSLKYAF